MSAVASAKAEGLKSQVSDSPPPATPFTIPSVTPATVAAGGPVSAPAVAASAPSSQLPAPSSQLPAATSAANPQVSGFKSQVSEPAQPARSLEPRAIQYIEALKVGAIMARSANDAKVLMNDRVYRVGSLVEPEMGLRLTGITPSSLTFGDASGGSYTRNF